MTLLKKFELTYGSFFGSNDELVWDNGRLLYRWGDRIPHMEKVIETDHAQWQKFLSAIQPVVVDWKRSYNLMVCDGLTWDVHIESDTLNLKSGGLHHFPEHYDTFLHHVRTILGCRRFAKGHSQKDYLVTGRKPALLNRNIMCLMRRKRRKLQDLADWLGYSKEWVRLQLRATTTFELNDLRKIASFLDMSWMDLLYERELSPQRRSSRVITFNRL